MLRFVFIILMTSLMAPMMALAQTPGFARRTTSNPNNPRPLYWAERSVRLEINYETAIEPNEEFGRTPPGIGEDAFRGAFRQAQTKWQEPGCTNFEFDNLLPSTSETATNLSDSDFPGSRCGARYGISTSVTDCINRVVFRTSKDERDILSWPQTASDERWASNNSSGANDEASNPQDVLALTTTIFNADTGRIIDADMDINGANFEWTLGELDLFSAQAEFQGVVTHELGHVLGFGHMNNEPSSIMNPYRVAGVNDLNKVNDENAVCTTYPIDSITPGTGDLIISGIEGGCSVSTNNTSSPWLLFLAATFIFWRRKVSTY